MNDKIPSKFTGFFIALIGSGMILSFISSVIERILLKNSEFSLLEYDNFGLYIFGLSLTVAIFWLIRVNDLKD
ncbi:hypothetical protein N9851_01550 [Acidimicrobiia bacterium]|jgi:hypothetical protein|nr:hypothetical protein [Acidimicrobiia bacterium]